MDDHIDTYDRGYIYCFSNVSMPGIHKIGITERNPKLRLNEANSADTWKPPTPYEIVLAKRVLNPKQKEVTLHNLLSQFTERVNRKREFFRVSQEVVKTFFELIDGDVWVETPEIPPKEINPPKENVKGSRTMYRCFADGQLIRHRIGNKTWIGYYCSCENVIVVDYTTCKTSTYKTLSGFAEAHYSIDKPERVSANGWKECECEVNGEWISTFNLIEIF